MKTSPTTGKPGTWIFSTSRNAHRVAGARSCRVVERGPLRAAWISNTASARTATLTQTVSLTAISPRLDFNTEVDWHERQTFLKVEFPLNVRAMHATYEIQFGHLQRPTHFNTSWDWARFEVPAHRWADLSELEFGVALLNDSKYGYATQDNVMRLSLLRSPTAPDPDADQGNHIFRYALLPHAGPVQNAGVIEEGIRFNNPLHLFPTEAETGQHSFFRSTHPALVLDTIKKAEDSDLLILRLYEARGTQGVSRILSSLPFHSAVRCNLLENEVEDTEHDWSEEGYEVAFKPFEIISLILKRA